MSGFRLAVVLLVGVVSMAATSCGDGSDDRSTASATGTSSEPAGGGTEITVEALDGKTYESTSVTGHDLVEGSSIVVAFTDGSMAVSAGCNTMFGTPAVDDGVLRWTGTPAATLMACSDELMAQDTWLTDLFTAGLDVTGDTTSPTLTRDDVVIELAGKE